MNRKQVNAVVLQLLVVAAFVAGAVLFGAYHSDASVTVGNEYNATLITSAHASGTAKTILKPITGTLGSVIISSSSPTTTYPLMTIYDATSTMATSTARKIAQFGGTPSTGTYTFDATVFYGLAVEVPVGFNGAYTITWR